ncbi:MAG: RloB family protein [Bacteroidota bacterium]
MIATEGQITEPQYFGLFNGSDTVVHIHCLKSRSRSSPRDVLQRMDTYLKGRRLRQNDKAWLVIDTDDWEPEQIQYLHAWAQQDPKRGLAVSNPKFEYWLLLHFEEGAGIGTSRECTSRLRRYLPDYDKHVRAQDFPRDSMRQAVARARLRDNPPTMDWPRETGKTTVYKLVDLILDNN